MEAGNWHLGQSRHAPASLPIRARAASIPPRAQHRHARRVRHARGDGARGKSMEGVITVDAARAHARSTSRSSERGNGRGPVARGVTATWPVAQVSAYGWQCSRKAAPAPPANRPSRAATAAAQPVVLWWPRDSASAPRHVRALAPYAPWTALPRVAGPWTFCLGARDVEAAGRWTAQHGEQTRSLLSRCTSSNSMPRRVPHRQNETATTLSESIRIPPNLPIALPHRANE